MAETGLGQEVFSGEGERGRGWVRNVQEGSEAGLGENRVRSDVGGVGVGSEVGSRGK